MGWVERVHVETELAQDTTRTANAMLHQMVEGKFKGDPQLVFAELVSTIDKAEAQTLTLSDAVQSMREASVPVFAQWEDDLLANGNPELRAISNRRLNDTRIRFQSLVAAAKHAETSLADFNRDALAVALFLRNDFNEAALTDVKPHAERVGDLAQGVQTRLGNTLAAARDYLQTGNLTGSMGTPAAADNGSSDPASPAVDQAADAPAAAGDAPAAAPEAPATTPKPAGTPAPATGGGQQGTRPVLVDPRSRGRR